MPESGWTATTHVSKYKGARPELAQAPMAAAAGLAESSLPAAWQISRNHFQVVLGTLAGVKCSLS